LIARFVLSIIIGGRMREKRKRKKKTNEKYTIITDRLCGTFFDSMYETSGRNALMRIKPMKRE